MTVAGTSWSFFFQAEDGIRDVAVTGVQTCALPISSCKSMTCHQTYMTHHSFPGYPGDHEPMADRRRAAGVAGADADDLAAERPDEPAAPGGGRRLADGLRSPGRA